MNLHELVSELIIDTKGVEGGWLFSSDSSLGLFLPEICLCVTMVLMLLVRVFPFGRRADAFYFAFFGSAVALWFAVTVQIQFKNPGDLPPDITRMEIFTGMLVYDPLTIFMRIVLIGFAVLFTVFTKLSGIPDREDGPDIYTLVLGATLGMCLMASANHLLMVFMAVEMASVPSYALAGLMKGRRQASEAALKYSVYGAGVAGVMLYGISLICGLLGTAHLPTLAQRLAQELPAMGSSELTVLALGGLMIMVGLAFKLSAVPFHFWCPDVFEGATAEVNAFLSVASKAAALALLIRVAIGFGAFAPEGQTPGTLASNSGNQDIVSVKHEGEIGKEGGSGQEGGSGLFSVADEEGTSGDDAGHGDAGDSEAGDLEDEAVAPASVSKLEALSISREFMAKLIAFFAAITCTFGNLAAYAQTNIKRLLAYSTIAHAGYMMMAVPAFLVMSGYDATAAEGAVSGLAVYIAVYLFMNLGAFAIVAFLRNAMRSEAIADYGGLIRKCPITVICFALILFSLVGLPPLSGFIGKFAIFAALADGFRVSAAGGEPATFLLALLIIGGINTAISLFYYLRVVRVMTIEPAPEDRPPFVFSDVSLQGAYIWLVTLPTALLIICWDPLNDLAQNAAKYLIGAA